MRYLLDTNAVIAVLRGNPTFTRHMKVHAPSDITISSIVAHELYFGAHKGLSVARNLERVDALQFPVIDFDKEDARRSGEVRAHLALAGMQIGPYDVLIAGQALGRGLTLVTHNTREFQRIPGLKLEDWQ